MYSHVYTKFVHVYICICMCGTSYKYLTHTYAELIVGINQLVIPGLASSQGSPSFIPRIPARKGLVDFRM